MSALEPVDQHGERRPFGTPPEERHSFSDVFSDALRGVPCAVHGIAPDDALEVVPVHDWLRPATRADQALLGHCRGTTLDVGCGPGRMSAHLALHGHPVLGIDIVQEAVAQARRHGVPALRRSVFDPMPGQGSWDTVLLADGNIGIGGDPLALLRRTRELLRRGGRVVCDLARPGTGIRVHSARLMAESRWSFTFPWASVGTDAIVDLGEHAGFHVEQLDQRHERWFAVLTR